MCPWSIVRVCSGKDLTVKAVFSLIEIVRAITYLLIEIKCIVSIETEIYIDLDSRLGSGLVPLACNDLHLLLLRIRACCKRKYCSRT